MGGWVILLIYLVSTNRGYEILSRNFKLLKKQIQNKAPKQRTKYSHTPFAKSQHGFRVTEKISQWRGRKMRINTTEILPGEDSSSIILKYSAATFQNRKTQRVNLKDPCASDILQWEGTMTL